MNRKELILAYITDNIYIPLKADELAVILDVPKVDMDEFYLLLDELEREGRIYRTPKGKYMALDSKSDVVIGTLQCNARKGFGFVRCGDDEGNDVFIDKKGLGNAYHNDKVLVKIDSKDNSRHHREGHIIRIIERGNKSLVGVVRGIKSGKFMIAPDKQEFFAEISVSQNDLMGAKKGDRVLVTIDRYTQRNVPVGKVITIFGNRDSKKGCLDGLLAERGLNLEFSQLVKSEVANLPTSVSPEEAEGREDLRDKIIFTIDGDDSRDFDDAVSLEKLPNGNMLLGVHIADVTYYVKDGTELNKEALNRATSVYFPHTVIPMLPKELSNGICSLNPDVDRLALTIFMELDKDGNLHSHRLCESVIHSKYRMTYNNVNKILEGDKELSKEYSEIVNILFDMNFLAKKLASKRKERGAIDFDFPESKVLCDENAIPIDIYVDERGDSQKLIESFMLIANETIAEIAYWAEIPFIYRVHEAPTNEKLTEFNNFIKNFGYSIKGKLDSDTFHPKALQEIRENVMGTPEDFMISKMMLRSLMKACYKDINEGHFGLSARFYCHFTSPIRRYPDLFVHRVLKSFIKGNLTDDVRKHYEGTMTNAAEISTQREIEAEKAERDAVDILKTAYMREFVGESFTGIITSLTSFGMFVTLENSCEGLIRYETMLGDYYEYDENSHCVKGVRSANSYKIGDTLDITVVKADMITRRIDFVRTEDNSLQTIRKIEKRALPTGTNKGRFRKKRKRR